MRTSTPRIWPPGGTPPRGVVKSTRPRGGGVVTLRGERPTPPRPPGKGWGELPTDARPPWGWPRGDPGGGFHPCGDARARRHPRGDPGDGLPSLRGCAQSGVCGETTPLPRTTREWVLFTTLSRRRHKKAPRSTGVDRGAAGRGLRGGARGCNAACRVSTGGRTAQRRGAVPAALCPIRVARGIRPG